MKDSFVWKAFGALPAADDSDRCRFRQTLIRAPPARRWLSITTDRDERRRQADVPPVRCKELDATRVKMLPPYHAKTCPRCCPLYYCLPAIFDRLPMSFDAAYFDDDILTLIRPIMRAVSAQRADADDACAQRRRSSAQQKTYIDVLPPHAERAPARSPRAQITACGCSRQAR